MTTSSNTTSLGSGSTTMSLLQQTVINKLTAAGEPVPAGFETATIVAAQEPAFVEEYTTTAATWLVMPYGDCDNSCGEGIKTRVVDCPAGKGACQDTMPGTQDACTDYEGCPFDPMCPMGRGITPDCSMQLNIMLGSAGLIILCWVLVIIRKIYLKCKPPKEGIVNFPEVMQGATYRVYTPNRIPRGKNKEDKTAARVTADGRTHVIWEIDQNFVEAWFQDKEEIYGKNELEDGNAQQLALPGPEAEDGSGIVLHEEAIADKAFDSDSSDDLAMDTYGKRVSIKEALPMTGNFVAQFLYQDGERVEYFSQTHQRWVMAKIKVEIHEGDDDNNLEPIVMYDVVMAHGIRHKNVQLDMLRPPFQHGELVELFSKRNGGSWLPGLIVGEQKAGATMSGYSVSLEDHDEVFQEIPSMRLRRRYPPGLSVAVYRGPREGWNYDAIVHHSAAERGIGAVQIPYHRHEVSHVDLHSLHDVRIREQQMMKAGELGISKASQQAADMAEQLAAQTETAIVARDATVLEQGLWTQVPIDLSKDDEFDDYVTLPSFLLNATKVDQQDHSRRQVAL